MSEKNKNSAMTEPKKRVLEPGIMAKQNRHLNSRLGDFVLKGNSFWLFRIKRDCLLALDTLEECYHQLL